MLIKTLDRWKAKPKKWGTYSLVQQSVYRNCEKIYGIDPANLAMIFPMWERSGEMIYDYSKYKTHGSFVGDLEWERGNLKVPSTLETYSYVSTDFSNIPSGSGTILFGIRTNWTPPEGFDFTTRYFFRTDGGEFYMGYVAFSDTFWIYVVDTLITHTYTDGISKGDEYNIAFVYGNNILYINGSEEKDGTDKNLGGGISNIYIGSASSATENAESYFKYFYVFTQALTSNQIALFNDRPYGLFEKNIFPTQFY